MYNPVQLKKWSEVSSNRRNTVSEAPQSETKEAVMEVMDTELRRIVKDNVNYLKQASEMLGEIALMAIDNNERNSG